MIILLTLALAPTAWAQTQIPAPAPTAGPVAFCAVHDAPPADAFQLAFDNREPETVTIVKPTDTAPATAAALVAYCNANAKGWMLAFTIAASRFSVRQQPYTVQLIGHNALGGTPGQIWQVQVGLKPGVIRITFVGQMPPPPQE
jgi:hypothetical protein